MADRKNANKYAVVDLEATGSGSDAKIIQIGIVILENGEIKETYATDINPYEMLDYHIQELTGISNQQLAQAPDFGQVAGEIFDLIGDAVFVAHNVRFDANLLAEALFFEGYELRTPRVDTVELAQVFFPQFEKYSLINLAQELNLDLEQAHTAISDAYATAQLLLKIEEKIASLPKQTVEQILTLGDHLIYESRLIIDEIFATMDASVPENIEFVHGLALRKPQGQLEAYHLSDDFATNLALLELDERAEQAQFVQLIEERLKEEKGVHFIQAQAGIGKTYGYLLPLLARRKENLLITVPTKILQQQIMDKEGKKLQELFRISISSVKSPAHYLKLDSFWKSLERADENRLLNRFKMQILVWLCETQTGDMDELRQKQRYQSYFDEIQHDGQLEDKSLFMDWDFWKRLQREAISSRVLITNHAYFLSHLQSQGYLWQSRLLVIDEAQKFLLTAEDFASQTIDLTAILQTLQSKKDKTEQLLDKRLLESTAFELNNLITHYRSSGQRDLVPEQLRQIKQNLLEMKMEEFRDLARVLEDYRQFWLEEHQLEDKRVSYLRASQEELLDVAPLLPQVKTFCISATLDLSKKVSLADLLGFKDVSFDRVSHRHYNNQELFLASDMPAILEKSREEHAAFILEEIQALQSVGKPILVLFTSIALLLVVSALLDEKEIDHLAQHKHGPEASLKRRFEKGESQLLLGTGVFWEGVDFANQEEMVLVITRLPFDNPKDRFVRKVNDRLRREGKNPFYDFSLPMMMVKLKQALGRTTRTTTQQSTVVILDNRLLTKRYGRHIIEFLQKEYTLNTLPLAELTEAMREFFD